MACYGDSFTLLFSLEFLLPVSWIILIAALISNTASWHLSWRTAKNHEKFQPEWPVSGLRYEFKISGIWTGDCYPPDPCVLNSKSRSRSYFTTDSLSVCLGIEYPCGTCDQILFPVGMLLSEICDLVSIGRPLWREDRSAICSVITRYSESLRTRTILNCLIWDSPNLEGQVPVFMGLCKL
jgi:hypothetical protein